MRPGTIKLAVRVFLAALDDAQREASRRTAPTDLMWLHPSMGRPIREEFGLWDDNDVLLTATGMQHPNDASMKGLMASHRALQQGQTPLPH
jgi:hypothetical protein